MPSMSEDVLRKVESQDLVRGVVALGPQLDAAVVDPHEPVRRHLVAEPGAVHAVAADRQQGVRARPEALGDAHGDTLDDVRLALVPVGALV